MEDGRRSADGQGQVDEVYLCPICNTKVSATQTECPGCGAIFSDGEDAASQARGLGQRGEADEDVDIPLEYRCPACGGSVGEEDRTCPHCGALFVEDAEEAKTPSPVAAEPAVGTKAPSKDSKKARARVRTPTEPPVERPKRRESSLEGVRLPTLSPRDGSPIAATQRRESYAVRHSRAVARLSKRRKLIAQRRMLGLALLAAGFAIYIGSLMLYDPGGFTMGSAAIIAVSIGVILIGVLILYNQHHAWRHYQDQLQTARIEAAVLRDRKPGTPKEVPTKPPEAKAKPRKVTPEPVQPREVEVEVEEAKAPPRKKVVTGAAAAVDDRFEAPAPAPEPRRVDLGEAPSVDPDKVACPNCGYLNRSIFVRCIRCGTELAVRDESIAVETFSRPAPADTTERPRPRGGPMPWEARHASSQGGRSAARHAARQAARSDDVEEEPESDDRRAAIGVAANFTKLPKNMREELIRTLYKVSDPVVRQDTVSAIAEHYTELPKDIQDLLLELADDEDPRVREEVAFEINRNFDRIPLNIIQTLFSKLARDAENLVREDVVSAIAENYQRLPKETQDLLKILAADKKESVRDEVSFEVAKNSDVIPEKFKSEIKEILRRTGS